MKYAYNLQRYIGEINSIIADWPVDIKKEKVIKWILQFDDDDIDLAIRIIRNLNVIGSDDIDYLLEIAYSKLNRKAQERGTKITNKNTVYAGMGEDGKSGSMISYHFRIINDISEENFLSDDSIKFFEAGLIDNIVLIDDVLLSGKQASKNIHDYTTQFIPLGVKNIFVLTLAGYRDGIREVEESTSAYVFSAYEFGVEDTYKSLDSKFYDGIPHEMRAITKKKMEAYGKFCMPKMPNGYNDLCALIAFYYNTPNATSPLIWSSNNGWIPLFKRALRINGVNSYHKQLQKTLEKTVEIKSTNMKKQEIKELTIFTEGKRDELLFEVLISDFKFMNEVGFEKITIIPLGGGYFSEKLIQKINGAVDNSIFIFDYDAKIQKNSDSLSDSLPIIFMRPSILMQCINFIRVFQDFDRLFDYHRLTATEMKRLDEFRGELNSIDFSKDAVPDIYESKGIYVLERLIASRGKDDRFLFILHEYFNIDGYMRLISDIRQIVG